MRYVRVFMIIVALMLSILWVMQADSKGRKVVIPAPIPQSGQTISYHSGDDGDLQKGVPWPDPRFTGRGDGTVRDNLTGLIWLQNTNCFGLQTWKDALDICNNLKHGDCDLTDFSVIGDWRLPNRLEMESLLDFGREGPTIPLEPPFVNYGMNYWTGTPYGDNQAWWMEYNGVMNATLWSVTYQVWPVRDPQ